MNSIKISFHDDVRRVKVDLSKPDCFENTVQQLKASFNLPAQAAVVLKYHDDEEELITVSSSVELAEAARVCADLGRKNLKLFAFATDSPAPAPAVVGDNEDAKSDASFVDVTAVPKPAPTVDDVKLAPPPAPVSVADEAAAIKPLSDSEKEERKARKDAEKEERKARKLEEIAARKAEKVAAKAAKLAAKQAKIEAKRALKLAESNGAVAEPVVVSDVKVDVPLSELKPPAKAIHQNTRCDGCDMFPLVGARFKCTTCRNFDLCEACEAKAVHPVDHVLLKINHPPATVDEQGRAIHRNVTCDGCHQHPLVGARFKCSVCDNYDLCQDCERAGKHTPEHPLLKIREPLEHRASRHVDRFCHRRLPDFLSAVFGPVTASVSETKSGEPDNEVVVELSCPVRTPTDKAAFVRGPRAPRCRREANTSDSEERPKYHRHHFGRKRSQSPVPVQVAAPVVVPVPAPAPAPAPAPVPVAPAVVVAAPAPVVAAPAPAPVAPVAAVWRRPAKFAYHEQLNTLKGMGFANYDACIKALVASKGDVNAAIDSMLN